MERHSAVNLIDCAGDILSTALDNGGDFAEIFLERKSSTSFSCEDDKVEKVVSGVDYGAGMRLIVGDKTLYAHTNEVSADGLMKLAKRVSDAVTAKPLANTEDFAPERFEAAPEIAPWNVPVSDKVGLVLAANEAARSFDQRIRQVLVRYGDSLQDVTIANSSGGFWEEQRVQSVFVVNVIAAEDGLIQTGYEPVGGSVGFELFEENDSREIALRAARRAILMLEADKAPTGVMPVVIGSEAGGTMIHEAVGHGLEADLVQKGLSRFAGKLGERVASDVVTVVDDGTMPRKRGSSAIDDEGTPASRTVLVEDGVLKSYLHDLMTAKKDSAPPTGNGRRESFRHKPIPRMTNTMIMPGKSDPEGIIADTKQGLYVRKMGGGQVNTVNGDFMFEVSEGYLIQDGKIGPAVRGAALVGNGLDVLQGIDLVGSDHGFAVGTCGKDGQGVPVSDAQPTVRIRELTIGGTAAG
jgi:TldD protein